LPCVAASSSPATAARRRSPSTHLAATWSPPLRPPRASWPSDSRSLAASLPPSWHQPISRPAVTRHAHPCTPRRGWIYVLGGVAGEPARCDRRAGRPAGSWVVERHTERKSTRLNSSHQINSYAVFRLKKKIISTSITLQSPYAS